MVEDRGNSGLDILQQQTDNLVVKGNQTPGLVGLFTVFRAEHAAALPRHRPRRSARRWASRSTTCSTRCRSTSARYYVNDFNQFGRTWQVNVQADARFRISSEDVKQLKVRNAQGRDGAAGHGDGGLATSAGR